MDVLEVGSVEAKPYAMPIDAYYTDALFRNDHPAADRAAETGTVYRPLLDGTRTARVYRRMVVTATY